MRFYALVLWRVHGRVPRLLQLLYLGSGEILRYEPDEVRPARHRAQGAGAVVSIRGAAERGDWRPHRSRLCDWCAHQALCPEFGGTPPALPLVRIGPPSLSVPPPEAVPDLEENL